MQIYACKLKFHNNKTFWNKVDKKVNTKFDLTHTEFSLGNIEMYLDFYLIIS